MDGFDLSQQLNLSKKDAHNKQTSKGRQTTSWMIQSGVIETLYMGPGTCTRDAIGLLGWLKEFQF